MTDTAGGSPLAEKLNLLFESVYPTGRGPYSNQEVAAEIRDRGGDISAVYIWQLRKGIRNNPTKRHLEALADFFQISPGYFFDDTVAAQTSADLTLLVKLRQLGAKKVALRTVLEQAGLSEASQRIIQQIVDRCLELEGLAESTAATATAGAPVADGAAARGADAPAEPAGAEPVAAGPSDAVPADATPSDAVPADATPSDAVPADATPSDAVPADAVPADARATPAAA